MKTRTLIVGIAILFLAQSVFGQESPNDTRVPPAAQIVDGASDVWTRAANGNVLRNGVAVGGAGSLLLYCQHLVYVLGTDSKWYRWVNGWVLVGTADPCANFENSPHRIYFDPNGNTGFGTQTPIFNDDGVTGANVGKYFAVDGVSPGASAYIGIGGSVTNLTDRVGQLAFYNWTMGGVDHRTAFIQSGNDGVLGKGYLDLATAPDNVGPLVRIRIASDGSVRIGNPFTSGGTVGVTALPSQSLIQTWFNLAGVPLVSMTTNGKVYLRTAGAPIIMKAPNNQCYEKSIDNAGNWVTLAVTPCPP